jgi:hypothetical protein
MLQSPYPARLPSAPNRFRDYYVPSSFAGIAESALRIPDDPKNYVEAMNSPEATAWCAAMDTEYESLIQASTWKLVPLPSELKAIRCTWIYKVKMHSDSTVARHKAHLVAQGCTQTPGIDFDQTFSPVVKYDSIRTILAIATQQQMHLTQFDIQTAFLHGVIDTIIYMIQPPGYEVAGPDGSVLVCLLLKSLYGLKQSGRIWNQTFDSFLVKFELEPTNADQCVYISKNDPALIITLFVDNAAHLTPSLQRSSRIWSSISQLRSLLLTCMSVCIFIEIQPNNRFISTKQYIFDAS